MSLDWGLILGVIGVIGIPIGAGIGVAVADPRTKGEYRFVCGCFIVAAILTALSFVLLTNEIPLGPGKIISAGVFGAVTLISLVVSIDWSQKRFAGHQPPEEKTLAPTHITAAPMPAPEPGILLDSNSDVLPRVAPPDGNIYIFEIRENQRGIDAGLTTYVFDPNAVIDWRKAMPEWPIFGVSKCEITSTTNDPVFDVVIPLKLVFQEMVPHTLGQQTQRGEVLQSSPGGNQMRSGAIVGTQSSELNVGRVYPQIPYVIYFVNRTKYLVRVEPPSAGKSRDFSKAATPDYERPVTLKLGRVFGWILPPSSSPTSPPAPPPQAPLQPNTPEKK